MNIVYAHQPFLNKVVKSIFLAGPTPRSSEVPSWRPEAIKILKDLGFDGTVFIPEPENGQFLHSYDDQISWEITAMNKADIILFWIPRELKTMPALTTNVEFGKWIGSGKVVVGFPKEAEKNRYLENLANRYSVTCECDLEETLKTALARLGEGSLRVGGETDIPLMVWKTSSFQNWYKAQKNVGNELMGATVQWTFNVGKQKEIVFLWVVHVDIFIKSENRRKTNEFVISRTNTASVVMFSRGENLYDNEIVLVKEFRSTASTKDAYIWELPGGSSFSDNENSLSVISNEIEEETGLKINKERLQYVQERQSSGTVLANKTTLFALELSSEELLWLKQQKGLVKGNEEDSERTYVEVLTVQQIMEQNLVDWSNLGMIMKASV